MRLTIAVAISLVACSHDGNVPAPGVPFCGASVHPCAGYPERDGAAMATCDDDNLTLSCQLDTGASYPLAVCVASCAAPAGAPTDASNSIMLAMDGIHLCTPSTYRASSWCATCDSDDDSLAYRLCDKDGFCDPVVCVHTCDSCELAP